MYRQTILESLQRFWLVLLGLSLLGAGIGAIYGTSKDPTYTASAELSVGRVDVATQSIPGFTQAALTLADSYARAIAADKVISGISEDVGISPTEVADKVTATPIPETGTVTVLADADSADGAAELANAAADQLIAYVHKLNKFNPDSKRLLDQYDKASQALGEAKEKEQDEGTTPQTEAAVRTAELKLNTLANLYATSQSGQASPNTLQILALAGDADSDKSSTVQQAALVGFVLGLLLGVLIAVPLDRRYPVLPAY